MIIIIIIIILQPDHRHVFVGQRRGQHDLQTEANVRIRVHQQAAANVHRYGAVQGEGDCLLSFWGEAGRSLLLGSLCILKGDICRIEGRRIGKLCKYVNCNCQDNYQTNFIFFMHFTR